MKDPFILNNQRILKEQINKFLMFLNDLLLFTIINIFITYIILFIYFIIYYLISYIKYNILYFHYNNFHGFLSEALIKAILHEIINNLPNYYLYKNNKYLKYNKISITFMYVDQINGNLYDLSHECFFIFNVNNLISIDKLYGLIKWYDIIYWHKYHIIIRIKVY
jgi:hypothetical protein